MKLSSQAVLVLAIMGAIGGWVIGFKNWADLATPQAIGGLFTVVASTLGAAFGVRTGQVKNPDEGEK